MTRQLDKEVRPNFNDQGIQGGYSLDAGLWVALPSFGQI
jgi:hypothetical protein